MPKEINLAQLAKKLNKPYNKVRRDLIKGKFPGARKVGHGWVIPQ